MYAFKEIRKVKNNLITIKIPDELKNKSIEIILLDVEDKIKENINKSNIDFLFDKIKIDTTKWKFNRDEIYES
jgi:diphthamide synthase subunit DPH2